MDGHSISTEQIKMFVDRLKIEQFRSSTKKTYYSAWHTFNHFFLKLDNKPDEWEDRLILFVGFLIDQNSKSATIASYVSAIKVVLRLENIVIQEDRYLINSLTRVCRYRNDKVTNRFPIHKHFLISILQQIRELFGIQPYLSTLYQTIFTTGYCGLLRVGELSHSDHVLRARDVHIGKNKERLLLVLHSSKTHGKHNKPQTISITTDTKEKKYFVKKHRCCPYQAIRNYIAVRDGFKLPDEQFFMFSDNLPVFPQHVRTPLKIAIDRTGVDSKNFNVHSLCIGRCCDLLKLGLSVETIKKIGRWKSNAVFKYLKN